MTGISGFGDFHDFKIVGGKQKDSVNGSNTGDNGYNPEDINLKHLGSPEKAIIENLKTAEDDYLSALDNVVLEAKWDGKIRSEEHT